MFLPVAEVVYKDKVVVYNKGNPKVAEYNNKVSTWEAMVRDLPTDFVFNINFLWDFCLHVSVPITWCKNTKKMDKKESFVPAYITHISKHQDEIMDADDVGTIALEWDGDKGVRNLIECTYIKFPTTIYVDYFWSIAPTADISSALYMVDNYEVSPIWRSLHKQASVLLESKAKKMKLAAIEKMGGHGKVFVVGEVVRVPVADVDKAKVNNSKLTGVIVKVNLPRMKAHVVVEAGLLKPWYNYNKLSHVSGPRNNINLLGLTDAFMNWKTMKVISE